MNYRVLLILGLTLAGFMGEAEGGGRVSIVFKRYRNPTSRKFNGHCCDLKLWGRCGKCDTYFKICVTDFANPRSMRHCPLASMRTGRLGRDDFHLHLSISRSFSILQGYMGLYVEAWDRDTFTPDDLVDKLPLTLPVRKPDPNNHPITVYLRTLRGRRATLSVEINVFCDSNYYGSSCTTYCKPRNDRYGHYTCTLDGHKVCRSNWHGIRCDTHCIEHDDDTNGHFKCDFRGKRTCRPGWYGDRCLKYCMESSGVGRGHYTCDSRGERVCRRGWYGENCMKYCVASDNDVDGHYTCDSEGRKVCRAGWYRPTGHSRNVGRTAGLTRNAERIAGPDCTKYCKAQDDDIAGHYTCDSNGDKVCNARWYGEKCTVYCMEHEDDLHGHYKCGWNGEQICNPGWGSAGCKVCAPGYHLPHCTARCTPHDNGTHGHYTCDKDDNKQCRMWWHGPNCTSYCVPQNDHINGHYHCDNLGDKLCHLGWHGQNCTLECTDQGSNASSCKFRGCKPGFAPPDCEKCLPGYYGVNCTERCVKGLSDVGNVVCSVSGDVGCEKWWYGSQCNVYCVPHDDDINGHYICDKNGLKRCILGWQVPGCKQKPTPKEAVDNLFSIS